MTARKRWYQLSMMQMLVAMAVVAALLSANLNVRRLEIMGLWVTYEPLLEIHEYKLSAGWPFAFVEARAPLMHENGSLDALRALNAAKPEVLMFPLLANLGIGLLVLLSVVTLTGIISRKVFH